MTNSGDDILKKVAAVTDIEELLKSDEFLMGLQIRGEALERRLGRLRKLALRASSHLVGKGERLAAKRAEVQALNTEIQSLKAEISGLEALHKKNTATKIQSVHLSEEILRSRSVLDQVLQEKKDTEAQIKKVEASIHKFEASAKESEVQLQKKLGELQQLQAEIDELWKRREDRRHEVQALESQKDAEQAELRSVVADTETTRAEKLRLESSRDELRTEIQEFRAEIVERDALKQELLDLRARQRTISEEVSDLSQIQKQHAEFKAELSEAQKKHAVLSAEHYRMVEEDARLRAFAESNSDLEARNYDLVRKIDELDASYKNSLQRNHELEVRTMSLQSVLQEAISKEKLAMRAVEAIAVEISAKNSEFSRLTAQIKDAEAEILKAQNEISSIQAKNIALCSDSEKIQAEIEGLEARFSKEEAARTAELEKRFMERATYQEKDLAARMHQAMQEIKRERQLWVEERNERRAQDMASIRTALDAVLCARVLPRVTTLEEREELRKIFMSDALDAIESIFDSKQSPEENTQLHMGFAGLLRHAHNSGHLAKSYWKKRGLQGGVLATILLGAIMFPSIPTALYQGTHNAFTRRPASSNTFVEQVRLMRAKRPKFLPAQDKKFRESYTDNMIYLLGYAELKASPEVREQWTLALDKFIQKELDLDDRVIVGFMTIESTFVAELEIMRARIRPETEAGEIARMRDFEAMSRQRLGDLVGGEEALAKIRAFEADFYQRYSTELAP